MSILRELAEHLGETSTVSLDSLLTEAQNLDSADAKLDSVLTEPKVTLGPTVSLDSGLREAHHSEPLSYPLNLPLLAAMSCPLSHLFPEAA